MNVCIDTERLNETLIIEYLYYKYRELLYLWHQILDKKSLIVDDHVGETELTGWIE